MCSRWPHDGHRARSADAEDDGLHGFVFAGLPDGLHHLFGGHAAEAEEALSLGPGADRAEGIDESNLVLPGAGLLLRRAEELVEEGHETREALELDLFFLG